MMMGLAGQSDPEVFASLTHAALLSDSEADSMASRRSFQAAKQSALSELKKMVRK